MLGWLDEVVSRRLRDGESGEGKVDEVGRLGFALLLLYLNGFSPFPCATVEVPLAIASGIKVEPTGF